MDTWLTGLLSDGSMTICNLDSTAPGSIATVAATETTPRHLEIQAQAATTETGAVGKVVVYSPEAYTDEEKGLEVPQGWSLVNWVYDGVEEEMTYTIEALTAKSEYHFDDSTVTLLNSAFTTPNGKVVGTIPGDPATEYDITGNITNGSIVGATKIAEYSSAVVDVFADAGYTLPESVSVDGVDRYVYENGRVSLYNPSGTVTITASCVPLVSAMQGNAYRGFIINPIDMSGIETELGDSFVRLLGSEDVGNDKFPSVDWTNHFDQDIPYHLVISMGYERLNEDNLRAPRTYVFYTSTAINREELIDKPIPAGWSIAQATTIEQGVDYTVEPLTNIVEIDFTPHNWQYMTIVDAKFSYLNGEAIGVKTFALEKISRGEALTSVKFDESVLNIPLEANEDNVLDMLIYFSGEASGPLLSRSAIAIDPTTVAAADIDTTVQGWNGVLVGKDDGNNGITAIQSDDTLSELKFGTSIDGSAIYTLFGSTPGTYWLIDGLVKVVITSASDIVITVYNTLTVPSVLVYDSSNATYPGWRIPNRRKGFNTNWGDYYYGDAYILGATYGVDKANCLGLQFRKNDDDYQIYDTKSGVVVYSFTDGFNTEVVTDGVYSFGEERTLDFVSNFWCWDGSFIGKQPT